MIPSCDHTGVPIHFHSSTTSGSASLMSLRILLKVCPRQSPSSAILLSISSDADWPSVVPGFFMFSDVPRLRSKSHQRQNGESVDHVHRAAQRPGVGSNALLGGRSSPVEDRRCDSIDDSALRITFG